MKQKEIYDFSERIIPKGGLSSDQQQESDSKELADNEENTNTNVSKSGGGPERVLSDLPPSLKC